MQKSKQNFSFPLLFLLPNILCLDAPAVALAWQEALARCHGIHLPWFERAILGLSVWMAYCADRWMDAREIKSSLDCSLRHRFQKRRPWLTPLLIGFTLPFTVYLAYRYLSLAQWRAGLPLMLVVVTYLLLSQALAKWSIRLPIKEIAVAILFAWGTVLFALSQPLIGGPYKLLPVIGFAALCFLNCWAIAKWEKTWDEKQGQISLATCLPQANTIFPFASMAFAGYVSADLMRLQHVIPLFQAISLSALLLVLLDSLGNRLATHYKTALADLVLLTPLLFFPFWNRM